MITVIGSINVDMVTTTALVPEQGQTVAGKDFQIKPGGKGANQAVAAARLGADVNMIGKVGQDAYGEEMLRVLTEENVTASMVEAAPGVSTGTANIIVSNQDNRIIVVPGANHEVTPAYVERFTEEILKSDLVLVQFEIPMETIRYILDLCSKHKIPVVVNPAPAAELPDEYWRKATYITPNETEAAQLFSKPDAELRQKLIITKGEQGVIYYENDREKQLPAYTVQPVDTTGAGDTFNGAFCVALSEGKSVEAAIDFANAAAALSIQKFGAQAGMPTHSEVLQFIEKYK